MEQFALLHGLNSVDIWQTKYMQLIAILIGFQTLGWNMILSQGQNSVDMDMLLASTRGQNSVDN